LIIEIDGFDYVPFVQHGGLGRHIHVFGRGLTPLLQELNTALIA
jgi:type I restriction enzyme R subunit